MAHNDWGLLSKLLECLDDERNDVFIHIDKKVRFAPSMVYKTKYAECVYIRRKRVSWGGYSQINVELDLLSAALEKDKYSYYHLISGQDLPIKNQDYIHYFFEQNSGKNYILFDPNAEKNHLVEERLQQYHYLQNAIGRNSGCLIPLLERIEFLSLSVQKKMKVNRITNCPVRIYKGRNWFSITYEMARYAVSRRTDIRKWFRFSLCADELFLQTIAMDSPLRETIVDNSLREIDWDRGKPYTYRIEDYEMLVNSPNLFARKFSTDVDATIIDLICNKTLSE